MRAVILLVLLTGLSSGQSFEVADVHVAASGQAQASGGFMPGGRVELRGTTMLDLISISYGLDPKMIQGGPGWINTDKFDVIAKAPSGVVTEATLQAMLKTLLAERFHLVVREEKRDTPVYVLTDGKKGAKLTPSTRQGSPDVSRKQAEGNQVLECKGCSMDGLAGMLPDLARNFVDRPVVNETKLEGNFDFQLTWMARGAYLAAKANPDGPPAIGMFEAVAKLGLKLEPQLRPQQVVVVVGVNQTPTPNAANVTARIPTFPTEFEVAEVRPAKANPETAAGQPGELGNFSFQNGRLTMMGATLKGLISLANNLDSKMIVSDQKWLDEDRFDVIAKAPANVPEEVIQLMIKNLLADRFGLKSHTEDRPVTVWTLAPGKGAARLKESDGSARSECKLVFTTRRNYVCQNTTMAQFVERLPGVAAAYVRAPLVNLTGLNKAYDFELYWTPKGQLPAGATTAGQASTPAGDVTVFEAVDKQLGLKLEEHKHPVPVLVIDQVQRIPKEQ